MTLHAASAATIASAEADLSVYVHFPWCLKKCPYCDFLSVAAERPSLPHQAYADAVIAELTRRAMSLGPSRLVSVFFGGGTPSLWEPSELGRVLERIFELLPSRAEEVEVTVECNPTSFDVARGRALKAVGVNRVSIGVQGLDAARLEFLGRLHDVDSGLAAVRDALESGMPRVSADFIFGVSGQEADAARREAQILSELGTTHLSAYALTIEPGTQFGALARKGKLPLLEEASVADSFLAVEETLEQAGFEHYEISNYAKPGEPCRHNLLYWTGGNYIGLGPSAASHIEGCRWKNRPHLGEWERAVEQRELPAAEIEHLTDDQRRGEWVMLRLRLSAGVSLSEYTAQWGRDARNDYAAELAQMTKLGLITLDADRFALSDSGLAVADAVASEFLRV